MNVCICPGLGCELGCQKLKGGQAKDARVLSNAVILDKGLTAPVARPVAAIEPRCPVTCCREASMDILCCVSKLTAWHTAQISTESTCTAFASM